MRRLFKMYTVSANSIRKVHQSKSSISSNSVFPNAFRTGTHMIGLCVWSHRGTVLFTNCTWKRSLMLREHDVTWGWNGTKQVEFLGVFSNISRSIVTHKVNEVNNKRLQMSCFTWKYFLNFYWIQNWNSELITFLSFQRRKREKEPDVQCKSHFLCCHPAIQSSFVCRTFPLYKYFAVPFISRRTDFTQDPLTS